MGLSITIEPCDRRAWEAEQELVDADSEEDSPKRSLPIMSSMFHSSLFSSGSHLYFHQDAIR
jgi:hypothetical protein